MMRRHILGGRNLFSGMRVMKWVWWIVLFLCFLHKFSTSVHIMLVWEFNLWWMTPHNSHYCTYFYLSLCHMVDTECARRNLPGFEVSIVIRLKNAISPLKNTRQEYVSCKCHMVIGKPFSAMILPRPIWFTNSINSRIPRYGRNFKKHNFQTHYKEEYCSSETCCEISLGWMPQNHTDEESTLVQLIRIS